MNKEEKINKLNKKVEKLTRAMRKESKKRMYNKLGDLVIKLNKEIEELRKKS